MEPKKWRSRSYSIAFKRKVVEEIEKGVLSIPEAGKLYDIGGSGTIKKWIIKMGKNHLINKVVRIETVDEINKLKKVEKEKQELEKALAQAHLKIISLESMIDIAENELGIPIKKK